MTSVLAYVLAILIVPVALSLMLFVMAFIEREPTSAPRVTPVAPGGTLTPVVGIDAKTNPRVEKNTPNAA